MIGLKTPLCEFGKKAVNFDLPGTNQQHWNLPDCRDENGLLVRFISNPCAGT